MNHTTEQQSPRSRWSHYRILILKGLFLYTLAPALLLAVFAEPAGAAVRSSDAAAYLLLLAAFGAVCLNWLIYSVIRRKRPSLLVFAHGVFCLFAFLIMEYAALPPVDPLTSSLADIGGCLVFAYLFLLSFWLASRRSKAAHAAAVVLWVIIGFIAVFMIFRIWRDFEAKTVTRETWITLAILAVFLPVPFSYRIIASVRSTTARRRASGLVAGNIVQILGETRLDRDDDLVTDYHARVQYSVDGVLYETRAALSGITVRRFGRKAFIGREIPVRYDPENPGSAFTDRIDRHFFDGDKAKKREGDSAGNSGEDPGNFSASESSDTVRVENRPG